MGPIRILVDSFADSALINAQMTNAREIIRRLHPEQFHVSLFYVDQPDPLLLERPHTRLIQLPSRLKTIPIFKEFVFGDHEILFYLKPSPASKWYLRLRPLWGDRRMVIGTVEGQCNLRAESGVPADYIRVWESTVLRSDYMFSNCHSVQKSLLAEYGRSSEVVPTGVDTDFFVPACRPPANDRPKVLFVGSLYSSKGPHTLLEAAERFPFADFVIVGAGEMARDLAQSIQRERLQNVRLAGALDRKTLAAEYQSADIFFFPSRSEGSPKVVLEAAASGLPVIVRNDYEPETVIDGETGYVVSSDQELFERLGQLLACRDLCRRMGQAGREHAKHFDWDAITACWAEVFQRLASRSD